MENIKKITVISCVAVISLGFCLTILAWIEPGGGVTAPGGTVTAPLNTGDADQTKTGRLSVGQGLNYWITKIGDAFALKNDAGQTNLYLAQDGKVGIGTTSPLGTVDVENGANSAQICIAGKCCSSWKNCFDQVNIDWANGSCAEGGCSKSQRLQYKPCTGPGCTPETRCVGDSTCPSVAVTPGSTYLNSCWIGNAKGTAIESRCGAGKICNSGSSWGAWDCSSVKYSFETFGCDVMKGWACNSYTPSDPLWLEFYMDETSAPGGYLGWSGLANGVTAAPATVAAACGGTSAHEFTFTMPKNAIFAGWPVHDGLPHQIYIAAKQSSTGGGWYMFPTMTLTCSQE